MPRPYRVVDVFAERRYAGNPLTVVLDAAGMSADEMQTVARETNHSETTFVLADAPRNGGWPVRIFTPTTELPFAGHPTLGTAAVLRDALGATLPLALDVPAGRVPVTAEGALLWLTAPKAAMGNMVQPAFAARALNLDPLDLDATAMPQVADAGVPFLVVPVEKLAALKRARFDESRLRDLAPRAGAELVYAISRETESPDCAIHARCFTGGVGIPEDPATGSAAAALGVFLVETGFLGSPDADLVVEQGIEIGRPSRLHVRARRTAGGAIETRVGGRVVPVAEGVLVA